jgi:hypothetical protein
LIGADNDEEVVVIDEGEADAEELEKIGGVDLLVFLVRLYTW